MFVLDFEVDPKKFNLGSMLRITYSSSYYGDVIFSLFLPVFHNLLFNRSLIISETILKRWDSVYPINL